MKVFFLQTHWGFESGTSEMTMQAYEAFLVEVGSYENIFTLDYDKFGVLATDTTWFKNFWELASLLNIDICLPVEHRFVAARAGDSSLMDLFGQHGFSRSQLEALNVVRKFLCVVHLSDILRCDGKTVRVPRCSTKHPSSPPSTDFHWKSQPDQTSFSGQMLFAVLPLQAYNWIILLVIISILHIKLTNGPRPKM